MTISHARLWRLLAAALLAGGFTNSAVAVETPEGTPADVVAVVEAMATAMEQGPSDFDGVRMPAAIAETLHAAIPFAREYTVRSAELLAARSVVEPSPGREVVVGVVAEDVVGRRQWLVAHMNFHDTGDGLSVETLHLYRNSPLRPAAAILMVPVSDGAPFAVEDRTHSELLHAVATRALSPENVTQGMYDIYAFVRDRLPDDAVIDLVVGSRPDGFDGRVAGATVIDFAGWRVARVRARLKAGEENYVKLVFQPGSDKSEMERTPRLVSTLAAIATDSIATDSVAADGDDIAIRLTKLQALYAQGLITEGEYDDKRRKILDSL